METTELQQQIKNLINGAKINQWTDERLAEAVSEIVVEMVDKIKDEVYAMSAVTTIQIEDTKLDVLTKYQVASLLNCYPHTPISEIIERQKNTVRKM